MTFCSQGYQGDRGLPGKSGAPGEKVCVMSARGCGGSMGSKDYFKEAVWGGGGFEVLVV